MLYSFYRDNPEVEENLERDNFTDEIHQENNIDIRDVINVLKEKYLPEGRYMYIFLHL